MNKVIFVAMLVMCGGAEADVVTLSQPGGRVITNYYGCETDIFALVPSDRENSEIFVTCEEEEVLPQREVILPGRYYTPFALVSVAYQGKLWEDKGCNLLSMFKEGNQFHYYFSCYTYRE